MRNTTEIKVPFLISNSQEISNSKYYGINCKLSSYLTNEELNKMKYTEAQVNT